MRGLDESTRENLLEGAEAGTRRVRRFWTAFADFAFQDNVLEVAVGLILAAAFTTVVTSFVSDVLLPPLSLLPFMRANLDEKFVILRNGPQHIHGLVYNTTEQAIGDGAVVMAYGIFLNKLLSFLGMGIALYTIASVYQWASHDTIIRPKVKCKYCRKWISIKAKRCVNCTSWLDGREDKDLPNERLGGGAEEDDD